jgi:hypothetical protein
MTLATTRLVPWLVLLVASWMSFFDYLTVKTKDPLAWWQNNCRAYPMLHRMALDYLSVPGMSPSSAPSIN